jgi:multidrug efflux pump subunit AcrA (membrane-fusion protein)
VWIVGDDNAVKRAEVKTGSMVGNDVVITSGISAGNIIVTEGYQKLSEGVKVVY